MFAVVYLCKWVEWNPYAHCSIDEIIMRLGLMRMWFWSAAPHVHSKSCRFWIVIFFHFMGNARFCEIYRFALFWLDFCRSHCLADGNLISLCVSLFDSRESFVRRRRSKKQTNEWKKYEEFGYRVISTDNRIRVTKMKNAFAQSESIFWNCNYNWISISGFCESQAAYSSDELLSILSGISEFRIDETKMQTVTSRYAFGSTRYLSFVDGKIWN